MPQSIVFTPGGESAAPADKLCWEQRAYLTMHRASDEKEGKEKSTRQSRRKKPTEYSCRSSKSVQLLRRAWRAGDSVFHGISFEIG